MATKSTKFIFDIGADHRHGEFASVSRDKAEIAAHRLKKSAVFHSGWSRKTRACFLALAILVSFTTISIILGALALGGAFTTTTASTTMTTVPPTVPSEPVSTTAPESSGMPDVDVTLRCNEPFNNGTCLAVFNYENPGSEAIEVPVGANNYAEPGAPDRNQTDTFPVGYWYGAVAIEWPCATQESLRWILTTPGGVSVATATAATITCGALPI